MPFISLHALFLLMAYNAWKKHSQKVGNICHCAKSDGEFLECDYWYILKIDLEYVIGYLHGVIAFDDDANQLMGISTKYMFVSQLKQHQMLK